MKTLPRPAQRTIRSTVGVGAVVVWSIMNVEAGVESGGIAIPDVNLMPVIQHAANKAGSHQAGTEECDFHGLLLIVRPKRRPSRDNQNTEMRL
jgi:hypothetical protein